MPDGDRTVRQKAEAARSAAHVLQALSDAARRDAVRAMADDLWSRRSAIIAANGDDLRGAAQARLEPVLVARLRLDEGKLRALLDGVRQVADLPDPVGRTLRSTELDEGLELYQVTVPIGVVGVVFESRPDALVQIAALAVRSGNAVLLKGGSEAEASNQALAGAIRAALQRSAVPSDAVQLLAGRAEVDELLALDGLVDLIVPRGSSSFVRYILDHTRIPVLGHAEGVCHIFVDAKADLEQALRVVVDAKTDYPAACNAVETVLVHGAVADGFLPRLRDTMKAAGVALVEGGGFGAEFGDLRLAVGVVPDLDAAIRHVNRYGSHHTDAIVTEDPVAARRFVQEVDAASVMVNASTRFADGFRYGLGAEVGISTSRIHARGPVGLEGLTTTKWVVIGKGHAAGDYQGPAARSFRHRMLGRALDEAWE